MYNMHKILIYVQNTYIYSYVLKDYIYEDYTKNPHICMS